MLSWSSCDSDIDWCQCLSSLWFNFFIYIAIIIFDGKMDCLQSCVQNWIETHHIIFDYCAVLLPHEAGDLLVGAFSGLSPSFLLRNIWLWHRLVRLEEKEHPISNIQHPTPFWIPNTRNLVFILLYGSIYHLVLLFIQLFLVNALYLTYLYVFVM